MQRVRDARTDLRASNVMDFTTWRIERIGLHKDRIPRPVIERA